MLRISKWCAIALLVATVALARDERYSQEFSRDLPYHGGRVTVEHSFGRVQIDTESTSEVHVTATIRSSDPEFGKQIRITAEQSGNGVTIRSEYPGRHNHGNHSFSVDFRITVPKNAALDVSNKFGSIEANDIGAPSSFTNSYGSIRLHNAKGGQKVTNSFGSIDAEDIAGEATLNNKYGSIRAHNINGPLAVSNGFGSIEVEDIGGNLALATQNASVNVRHVEGSATLSNSFASVNASDIRGDASISNQNGKIDATDIKGNAILRTTFASVRAQMVTGRVEVEDQNGSVQLEDIGGDATVRTSFATAQARDVKGAIDITNQNGAITVSQNGPQCRPISLKTSFSSIRVGLPSKAGYSVNARTSFGRITSSVPITTRASGDDTLIGTIGNGGCRLELVNSNGSITIDQE